MGAARLRALFLPFGGGKNPRRHPSGTSPRSRCGRSAAVTVDHSGRAVARSAAADDPVARVSHATVRFGDETALDDVSLDVNAGSVFGFIGPSGSGKTTTVRLLTGALQPTEGSVEVMGTAPTDFGTRERERIGYMPQLSVLYPHLSLWENLNFAASMYGMRLRRRDRLKEVLELVELDGQEKKLLRDASGGMQRRLALAATLVHDPQVYFLDEPTAGIDPVLRRKLWDHFEALRDAGRTLFVTTQYVGEAAYCDDIGVLADGRVVALDTPDGLRRRAFGGELIEAALGRPIDGRTQAALDDEAWVHAVDVVDEDHLEISVDDAETAIPRVQAWFEERGTEITAIRQTQRPFDDVFVELVERETRGGGAADGQGDHDRQGDRDARGDADVTADDRRPRT